MSDDSHWESALNIIKKMIVRWFDADDEEESGRIIWTTRKGRQEGREEQNGEIVRKSKGEWRIKEKKKNKGTKKRMMAKKSARMMQRIRIKRRKGYTKRWIRTTKRWGGEREGGRYKERQRGEGGGWRGLRLVSVFHVTTTGNSTRRQSARHDVAPM